MLACKTDFGVNATDCVRQPEELNRTTWKDAARSLDLARPRIGSKSRIAERDVVRHGSVHGVPGVQPRIWREGPEFDLLTSFLQSLSLSVPRGARVKLFHQPRLESGFPDAVLVVWRPSVAKKWPAQRGQLKPFDLRVLHYLTLVGNLSDSELHVVFGHQVRKAVDRLIASGTVLRRRDTVCHQRLDAIFAVSKIVAVEAKMRDWRGALDQAVLNTWFSDESWMLMPHGVTQRIANECHAYSGVRCVSPEDIVHDFRSADCSAKPVSYASWMFNEWAWRLSLRDQNVEVHHD